MHRKSYELIKCGNISKAMSFLENSLPLVAPTEEAFNKLESKFPTDKLLYYEDQALLNQLKTFESSEEQVLIQASDLRKMIQRLKTGVHPGIDKLKHQHLKQLVGFLSEPDSDEETFVEYLAEIIGKIANGLEPSEISSVLRDNVLIAAPKSNGDVRLVLAFCIASWQESA
jgi:hypothetical protein